MRTIAIILTLALAGCGGVPAWQKPGSTEADFKNASYDCERDVLTKLRAKTGLTTNELFNRCMEAEGWQPAEEGTGYPNIAL